ILDKQSVFTFFKKYSFIWIILILLLTGCSNVNEPIDANATGWFDSYFVYNFSQLIKWLASFLNGSFGFSIIIITLIILFAIMPFMLKQTRNSLEVQDKMKIIKPEMDAIQNKYKGKNDTQSKNDMQQELMKLYQQHQFNPLA